MHPLGFSTRSFLGLATGLFALFFALLVSAFSSCSAPADQLSSEAVSVETAHPFWTEGIDLSGRRVEVRLPDRLESRMNRLIGEFSQRYGLECRCRLAEDASDYAADIEVYLFPEDSEVILSRIEQELALDISGWFGFGLALEYAWPVMLRQLQADMRIEMDGRFALWLYRKAAADAVYRQPLFAYPESAGWAPLLPGQDDFYIQPWVLFSDSVDQQGRGVVAIARSDRPEVRALLRWLSAPQHIGDLE